MDVVELADAGDPRAAHLAERPDAERLSSSSESRRATRPYMASRQVQKLPEPAGKRSPRPRRPRWKACECVEIIPGRRARPVRRRSTARPSAPTSAMRPSWPTCTWTPDSKRSPVQVQSASRISAGRLKRGPRRMRWTVRWSSVRGRGELVLGDELVRLVGDLDRARAEDGAVHPQALEPAGVGGEGDARAALLADQAAEVAVDGGGFVEQHGRAVGEDLEVGLAAGRGLAGGAAHALDQRRGREPRQWADPHFQDAAVRDDVDRRAAADRADVERHVGDLGEELAMGDLFGLQLAAQGGQGHDDPAGGLDGVEPQVRVAAVGAAAAPARSAASGAPCGPAPPAATWARR